MVWCRGLAVLLHVTILLVLVLFLHFLSGLLTLLLILLQQI
jgi:hypothetical protein